ncbi:hypothetical protein Syun_022241 [Stephania yunnanensis]|uniref:Uncharacterized protein n=1 Tax=Stephania yunnanensis TaxID=152371 RepID=A0AAP0IH49_9MAGN
MTKMVSYCAYHRVPDPDIVLIIQSPLGVFSTKSMLRSKTNTGPRLISYRITEVPQDLDLESEQFEPFSAARCRTFKRSKAKVTLQDAMVHRLRGPCHHSLEEIESLNKFKEEMVTKSFSTFKESLHNLRKLKMTGFASVDLEYMDGASLLVMKFKKEKW